MIVELYGLPGSGKTTLAKRLGKESDWELVQVSSKYDILYHFFLGFLSHPKLFLIGAFFSIRHGSTIFHLWNSYCVRYAKYQKATKSKKKYVVLDEGLMQCALAVLPREVSESQAEKFLEWNLVSNYVVVFDIAKDIREKHLEMRAVQRNKVDTVRNVERDKVIARNYMTTVDQLQHKPQCIFFTSAMEPEDLVSSVVSKCL